MVEGSALDYLIGAYLNEDVFNFYPDVMAGVDDFVQSDPEMVVQLGSEIDEILRTRSDHEIDELLTSYGIGFIPGELGYRGWLSKIGERVRAASTAHPAS